MHRSSLVLLLTSVLATPLAAQQWPVTMLPVPPMPSIGLPLPHIGLPPVTSAPESVQQRARPSEDRAGRQRRGHGAALVPLFVAPIYVIGAPAAAAPAPDEPHEVAAAETATLRLEIEPSTESQVYVDGYYVGASDGSDDLDLTAGPHRVEVRAAGYEPVTFDVRLSSRQPITYRARLARIQTEPTTSAPRTSAPMTLYVIPGCYAGNVPPSRVTLAPGCDPSRLTTLER